jgi:uncharacterized membrane protein YoaK (UPF0700 family)
MKTIEQGVVRDLLFLSFAAGSADAAGYMGLGRVFTSNMTGNVVLLGIDIGEGHLLSAGRTVLVLATFILGVTLGAVLGQKVKERDWGRLAARIIGLEKIVLVLFAIGWLMRAGSIHSPIDSTVLFLLTLAMGLQASAMNRLSAPGASTTAITGTLTVLIAGLVQMMVPASPPTENSWERIKFQSAMILLYCCGAAACGYLILHVPVFGGCLPALAILLVWPKIPRNP